MKRLAIIFSFLMVSLLSIGQIPINDVSFKAFRVDVYLDGKQDSANCNDIFYIKDNQVITTLNNQAKRIYFQEELSYQDIGTYNDNLHASSEDAGGFKCQFYIVYTPAEKTKSKEQDIYNIVLYYSNVMLNFQCYLTEEKPWFMNRDIISELIAEGEQYEANKDFTMEDVDAFLSQIGDPAKIMAIIMASFYQDLADY